MVAQVVFGPSHPCGGLGGPVGIHGRHLGAPRRACQERRLHREVEGNGFHCLAWEGLVAAFLFGPGEASGSRHRQAIPSPKDKMLPRGALCPLPAGFWSPRDHVQSHPSGRSRAGPLCPPAAATTFPNSEDKNCISGGRSQGRTGARRAGKRGKRVVLQEEREAGTDWVAPDATLTVV